jgi:hypothetical protein
MIKQAEGIRINHQASKDHRSQPHYRLTTDITAKVQELHEIIQILHKRRSPGHALEGTDMIQLLNVIGKQRDASI